MLKQYYFLSINFKLSPKEFGIQMIHNRVRMSHIVIVFNRVVATFQNAAASAAAF
jgi:hypothetical protein